MRKIRVDGYLKASILCMVMALMIAVWFGSSMLTGCTTVQTYRAGGGVKEMALASCQDLQLSVMGASAAVAWSMIYFPDQQAVFISQINPKLEKAQLAVNAYCSAAELASTTTSLQDLVANQALITQLVNEIQALLVSIRK
jgi:hypothetical protein